MVSLGDFSCITPSKNLGMIDNRVFWLAWLLISIITCIVFLNFVVCEACASYSKVKECLEQVQIQSRALLIAESEQMALKRFKNNEMFPKYLIVRTID